MSLFNIADAMVEKKELTNNKSVVLSGSVKLVNEEFGKNLEAVIGNIEMGKHIHFFTKNAWTVPDLVLFILSQTGKANIYIATWAMKEFPARKLVNAKQHGLIDRFYVKLDHRVKTYDSAVYFFLKKNADEVNLAHCHAKVTVIENEDWGVVITGSANYSANPRAEAGVITCDKIAAATAKEWILNFTNEKSDSDGVD